MANVLTKIIDHKRSELIARKIARPLTDFISELTPSQRDFYGALRSPRPGYILECKKASPSKGLIRADFDLGYIASVYKQYASCISVLTDEQFFQGSFDYVAQVRAMVNQPILCKDFFIDPYQIYLARLMGADAVLLMLSVLDDQQYRELHVIAEELNMAVLTEVSNQPETERAVALGAKLIGINNRNLRDLSTDLATTEQLRPLIPSDRLVISESGIYQHQDVKRLAPICNGFLVGSSLMAQPDLDLACRQLILGNNKVCGLTREQDARDAFAAGACYGGLIFVERSPRYVDLDCAKAIRDASDLQMVGVFANADCDFILERVHQLKLSAVQLHGLESLDTLATLKAKLPSHCQLWQVLSIEQTSQQLVNDISQHADRYVIDCKVASQLGGTGQAFNWQVLSDIKPQLNGKAFLLAGGISATNIAEAVRQGAAGLDLNSGVELSSGKKCRDKLTQAFSLIRQY